MQNREFATYESALDAAFLSGRELEPASIAFDFRSDCLLDVAEQ